MQAALLSRYHPALQRRLPESQDLQTTARPLLMKIMRLTSCTKHSRQHCRRQMKRLLSVRLQLSPAKTRLLRLEPQQHARQQKRQCLTLLLLLARLSNWHKQQQQGAPQRQLPLQGQAVQVNAAYQKWAQQTPQLAPQRSCQGLAPMQPAFHKGTGWALHRVC